MRPIIMNGIEEFAASPDICERAIKITMPEIKDYQRKEEADFWSEFEQKKPQILGALLDLVSKTLQRLPGVKPEHLPRMADFGKLGIAVEQCCGWESGTFIEAHRGNQDDMHAMILEISPVTDVLKRMLKDKLEFRGTMEALRLELNKYLPNEKRWAKGWPQNARALRSILDRIAPNLRSIGIRITHEDKKDREGNRKVRIWMEDPGASVRHPEGIPHISQPPEPLTDVTDMTDDVCIPFLDGVEDNLRKVAGRIIKMLSRGDTLSIMEIQRRCSQPIGVVKEAVKLLSDCGTIERPNMFDEYRLS